MDRKKRQNRLRAVHSEALEERRFLSATPLTPAPDATEKLAIGDDTENSEETTAASSPTDGANDSDSEASSSVTATADSDESQDAPSSAPSDDEEGSPEGVDENSEAAVEEPDATTASPSDTASTPNSNSAEQGSDDSETSSSAADNPLPQDDGNATQEQSIASNTSTREVETKADDESEDTEDTSKTEPVDTVASTQDTASAEPEGTDTSPSTTEDPADPEKGTILSPTAATEPSDDSRVSLDSDAEKVQVDQEEETYQADDEEDEEGGKEANDDQDEITESSSLNSREAAKQSVGSEDTPDETQDAPTSSNIPSATQGVSKNPEGTPLKEEVASELVDSNTPQKPDGSSSEEPSIAGSSEPLTANEEAIKSNVPKGLQTALENVQSNPANPRAADAIQRNIDRKLAKQNDESSLSSDPSEPESVSPVVEQPGPIAPQDLDPLISDTSSDATSNQLPALADANALPATSDGPAASSAAENQAPEPRPPESLRVAEAKESESLATGTEQLPASSTQQTGDSFVTTEHPDTPKRSSSFELPSLSSANKELPSNERAELPAFASAKPLPKQDKLAQSETTESKPIAVDESQSTNRSLAASADSETPQGDFDANAQSSPNRVVDSSDAMESSGATVQLSMRSEPNPTETSSSEGTSSRADLAAADSALPLPTAPVAVASNTMSAKPLGLDDAPASASSLSLESAGTSSFDLAGAQSDMLPEAIDSVITTGKPAPSVEQTQVPQNEPVPSVPPTSFTSLENARTDQAQDPSSPSESKLLAPILEATQEVLKTLQREVMQLVDPTSTDAFPDAKSESMPASEGELSSEQSQPWSDSNIDNPQEPGQVASTKKQKPTRRSQESAESAPTNPAELAASAGGATETSYAPQPPIEVSERVDSFDTQDSDPALAQSGPNEAVNNSSVTQPLNGSDGAAPIDPATVANEDAVDGANVTRLAINEDPVGPAGSNPQEPLFTAPEPAGASQTQETQDPTSSQYVSTSTNDLEPASEDLALELLSPAEKPSVSLQESDQDASESNVALNAQSNELLAPESSVTDPASPTSSTNPVEELTPVDVNTASTGTPLGTPRAVDSDLTSELPSKVSLDSASDSLAKTSLTAKAAELESLATESGDRDVQPVKKNAGERRSKQARPRIELDTSMDTSVEQATRQITQDAQAKLETATLDDQAFEQLASDTLKNFVEVVNERIARGGTFEQVMEEVGELMETDKTQSVEKESPAEDSTVASDELRSSPSRLTSSEGELPSVQNDTSMESLLIGRDADKEDECQDDVDFSATPRTNPDSLPSFTSDPKTLGAESKQALESSGAFMPQTEDLTAAPLSTETRIADHKRDRKIPPRESQTEEPAESVLGSAPNSEASITENEFVTPEPMEVIAESEIITDPPASRPKIGFTEVEVDEAVAKEQTLTSDPANPEIPQLRSSLPAAMGLTYFLDRIRLWWNKLAAPMPDDNEAIARRNRQREKSAD